MNKDDLIYCIERCISHVPDACRDCSYDADHPYNECVELLLRDVLQLLKEQEEIEPDVDVDTWVCGNCHTELERQELISPNVVAHDFFDYCPRCGKKVKWSGHE